MAAGYTLYYWPIPFRGHFVRYLLAHVGADWQEAPVDALIDLKDRAVAEQPYPFMAPPVLVDHAADIQFAQLPAILGYLAGKHALLPGTATSDALAHKLVGDCNDVLNEMTRFGGEMMWTREEWRSFSSARLPRWLEIFEETARRHGLGETSGHILGTQEPTLADLATAALWFTMREKLPPLASLLDQHAPATMALSRRISETPRIASMRANYDRRFGEVWCGGEIEKSLRAMLAEP